MHIFYRLFSQNEFFSHAQHQKSPLQQHLNTVFYCIWVNKEFNLWSDPLYKIPAIKTFIKNIKPGFIQSSDFCSGNVCKLIRRYILQLWIYGDSYLFLNVKILFTQPHAFQNTYAVILFFHVTQKENSKEYSQIPDNSLWWPWAVKLQKKKGIIKATSNWSIWRAAGMSPNTYKRILNLQFHCAEVWVF